MEFLYYNTGQHNNLAEAHGRWSNPISIPLVCALTCPLQMQVQIEIEKEDLLHKYLDECIRTFLKNSINYINYQLLDNSDAKSLINKYAEYKNILDICKLIHKFDMICHYDSNDTFISTI
jgi:hypothetical protein